VAIVALLLGARSISAQASDPEPPESTAPLEDISAWQYFCEIAVPVDAAEGAWFDTVLDRAVFSGARPSLADLRLRDASGRDIPFALRIRRPIDDFESVAATEFNRAAGPDESVELSLDLGDNPPEHNQVQLKLPGDGFRRRVVVSGSSDAQEWSQLADDFVVRFEGGGQRIDDDGVDYPKSRFRYLRVRVYRDPVADEGHTLDILSAAVRRRVERPGENFEFAATLGKREPVRVSGQAGSAWLIDLGGENIPCGKLLFTIDDAEFVRQYELESRAPPESFNPFHWVSSGEWRRRRDEPLKPMEIDTGDLLASQLRLKVQDVGNPPLAIRSVQVSAPAREVVLRWPTGAQAPLRLYFGNPRAESPQYDFARNLPTVLPAAPARLELGARQENPSYVPPPLPLTERWPWAIYVVLGAACLVLALVIASVARQAIAVADARV
jgi:hypothetical protein